MGVSSAAWVVDAAASRPGGAGPALTEQWVPLRQLVRVPGRQPVPDGLLADLVLRHRREDLVVDQQAIDVQRLGAGRIRGFELDGLAPFGVLDAGQQRRLEQFGLVLVFFHASAPVFAR